jgi:hypothetical protein
MSLTPCSKVLPEKLRGPQLVRKFPTFCETQMFIAAFTRAHHFPRRSNMIIFLRWGVVSTSPKPKLEDHPFLAFRDYLFNIFLPYISGGRCSIRNLRTRHAVVTGNRIQGLRFSVRFFLQISEISKKRTALIFKDRGRNVGNSPTKCNNHRDLNPQRQLCKNLKARKS